MEWNSFSLERDVAVFLGRARFVFAHDATEGEGESAAGNRGVDYIGDHSVGGGGEGDLLFPETDFDGFHRDDESQAPFSSGPGRSSPISYVVIIVKGGMNV